MINTFLLISSIIILVIVLNLANAYSEYKFKKDYENGIKNRLV